jgi:hypothetical protein
MPYKPGRDWRGSRLRRRLDTVLVEIFVGVGVLPISDTVVAQLDVADLAGLAPTSERDHAHAEVFRGFRLRADRIVNEEGIILAGFTAGNAGMVDYG